MYANVRNARIRCGDSISVATSGFSRWICSMIAPSGSSTSGIQRSSRPAMPGLWLLAAGAPGDLPRGTDEQHGEQLAQRGFRERERKLGTADRCRNRRYPEDRSCPPAHVSVPLLPPDADEHRRDDGEQRRRLRMELREPDPGQDRDEEDAAAHTKEAGHHACDHAKRRRHEVRRHWSSIRMPITTSSPAKRNDRV